MGEKEVEERREVGRRATGFKDVRRPREKKPGGRSERNGGGGLSSTATSGH